MSIVTIITAAQAAILTAVTKVQYAPVYPDDARTLVPTMEAAPDNIKGLKNSGGYSSIIFDLKLEFLVGRNDLNDTATWLAGVPEAVLTMFMNDPTISGTCQTYSGDVTALQTARKVGDIDCIGYVFTVPGIIFDL
jgi:hypothetical protein